MNHIAVIAFKNESQAFELQKALLRCEEAGIIEMADNVVVVRDAAGKIKIYKSADAALAGASVGTTTGLIVGLIFMQPWVGAVVGLGTGAVLGALANLGIKPKFVKEVSATLTPGSSAWFGLGRNWQLDKLKAKVGTLFVGCTILHTTVDRAREDEFRKIMMNLE